MMLDALLCSPTLEGRRISATSLESFLPLTGRGNRDTSVATPPTPMKQRLERAIDPSHMRCRAPT